MIALIIILAILAAILLLPVGAEASFIGGELSVKAKAGPVKLRLFPRKKAKTEKVEEAKPKKEKPPKAKKPKDKSKKNPLTMEDIFGIAKLGLKALNRFRKSLSIDELTLHICAGSPEPFDAVKQYGYLNAALGTLHPLLHQALKIRREDIATAVSFETEKTTVDARLAATLRIGEILYIGACAGFGFLAWMHRRKKRVKRLAAQRTGAAQTNTAQANTCA